MWPYRIIIVREEVVILKNRPTEGEASYVVSDSIISYLAGAKQGYIALLKKARRLVVNRVPTKLRSQILRRVV